MSHTADPVYAATAAFVDELARGGMAHVCICPGSRSTPLALAFAAHSGIRVWMHLDERSAAFFALGLAKGTGAPVAVLCTSGTATANFMPAVVEARHGQAPLLVLTADRPHELRDCGAPQTIDQIRFYGAQVKWAAEMPLPEATEPMLRHARTMAARALAVAAAPPRGPVHLNFPFREPLLPAPADDMDAVASMARGGGQPYTRLVTLAGPPELEGALAALAAEVARTPHGLIVCGPMDEPELPAPLGALALHLEYPILTDPLSGLRCGAHERTLVIDSYDAFLRDETFAQGHAPALVLRFGAMPTSKPLLQYLQRHPGARQIVVSRDAAWRDPTLLAAEVIIADPVALCMALSATEEVRSTQRHRDTERVRREAEAPIHLSDVDRTPLSVWAHTWLTTHARTRAALVREVAAIEEPFEGRAMAELADLLPDGAVLVAGNSMPVRDIDTFFAGSERDITIMGNRGASGIDGVVSTALGLAAAVAPRPVVLAIGDLSLYHDSNGLLAAARHGLNLTIVLLNNDGGGIFSFLPQAQLPAATYEPLFGTPHGLDFVHLAALYHARYTLSTGWAPFRDAVRAGIEQGGLHLVELRTDRARNVALHRRLWPAVSAALRETPPMGGEAR